MHRSLRHPSVGDCYGQLSGLKPPPPPPAFGPSFLARGQISCDACQVWMHTRCNGIPDSQQVPARFTCQRCLNARDGVPSSGTASEATCKGQAPTPPSSNGPATKPNDAAATQLPHQSIPDLDSTGTKCTQVVPLPSMLTVSEPEVHRDCGTTAMQTL